MRKAKFSRTISIIIADAMYQVLKHASDLQEVSISELIRSIIDQHIKKEGGRYESQ